MHATPVPVVRRPPPRSVFSRPLSAAKRILCLALSVIGCAGEESPADDLAGEGAVITDSASVELVSNSGSGWSPASRWRLHPDLQVGDVDGPMAFGNVRWVAPGPDGGMLVLDSQSRRVHLFARDGSHRRSFGREGDGPGEFRRPASVTFVPGDRIAVTEGFPPVVHWLDTTGAYLEALRLPGARAPEETRTAGFLAAWQVTTTGLSFAQVMILGPPSGDRAEAMPVRLLRFGQRAAMPDTMLEWTWEPGVGSEEIRVFEPQKTWAPGPDGAFLFSPGGPYEVRAYDSAGSLVRIVSRAVPKARVTRQHREAALREMREEMTSGGAPQPMIDEMLDHAVFEAALPHLWRVWLSEPDGCIWVGVHDPDLAPADGPSRVTANAWDIFSPAGSYLGRLPAPDGFSLHVVRDGEVYGAWENELQVPYAVRYRVVRPG